MRLAAEADAINSRLCLLVCAKSLQDITQIELVLRFCWRLLLLLLTSWLLLRSTSGWSCSAVCLSILLMLLWVLSSPGSIRLLLLLILCLLLEECRIDIRASWHRSCRL